MFTYDDLVSYIRGPISGKPFPIVYDFAPCFARMVGGIPDLTRFYFDTDEKLGFQLKLKELFPDALVLPGVFADFGVIAEVSAFGGQIVWMEGNAPFIQPSTRETREIDGLRVPMPGTTGLTALLLAQQRIMREKLHARGLEMEKWALSMGPAEVSGLLLGYDKFYMGLYDDPGRIKRLLEMVTDFIIPWIKRQGESVGGTEVMMIADHVCGQIDPAQAEEFVLPFMKAIFEAFPKAIKIYHNEGFHSDRHIDLVLRFGADVWHFGSDVHDLSSLYSKVGSAIIPWGGLNPHGVIRLGTPPEVKAETRAALLKSKGFKLLLSTGTGTTPDAPLANVRAMVEAADAG